jgi:hypothetical protein
MLSAATSESAAGAGRDAGAAGTRLAWAGLAWAGLAWAEPP